MAREALQRLLDSTFPNGARVVVVGSQPPIAFWTSRVVALDESTIVIVPVFWDHGAEFVLPREPVVSEKGTEVTFPQAYVLDEDTRLDIRLDTRFSPVGLEDQIALELSQRNDEWLKMVVADHEAGKVEDNG